MENARQGGPPMNMSGGPAITSQGRWTPLWLCPRLLCERSDKGRLCQGLRAPSTTPAPPHTVHAAYAPWEDAVETQTGQAAPAQAPTEALSAPREDAQPTPAAPAIPAAQPEPTQPIQASWVEPAPARATSRMSIEPDQPATPKNVSPPSGHDGDGRKNGAPRSRALGEFLKSISPEDLGGK